MREGSSVHDAVRSRCFWCVDTFPVLLPFSLLVDASPPWCDVIYTRPLLKVSETGLRVTFSYVEVAWMLLLFCF